MRSSVSPLMFAPGRGLRPAFVLLCLAALAALLASASWSDHEGDTAGVGDPDAVQVSAPPQPDQAKTSPNAYFRAKAQVKLLQSSGPTLSWASVGKGPINGGYGPS